MDGRKKTCWIHACRSAWLLGVVLLTLAPLIPALASLATAAASSCQTRLASQKLAVVVGSSPRHPLPFDDPQAALLDIRSMVESALLDRGFQLVDPALLKSVVDEHQKRLILAGDVVSAVHAASRLGADLMLAVAMNARLRKITAVQTHLKSVFTHFSFRLIDRNSARVLDSIPFQGTAAALDPAAGAVTVLQRGLESIAQRLRQAYCRWSQNQKPTATVSASKDTAPQPWNENVTSGAKGPEPPRSRVEPDRGGADVLHPDPSSLQDL